MKKTNHKENIMWSKGLTNIQIKPKIVYCFTHKFKRFDEKRKNIGGRSLKVCSSIL